MVENIAARRTNHSTAAARPARATLIALAAWIIAAMAMLPPAPAPAAPPPGVVIDHVPASSGLYVGSPSIAVLPNGDYVASHDLFGPKSTEHVGAITRVFRSSDHGQTWKQISEIQGQFWSSLFVHRGNLYIIGTNKHHGNAIIRRSADGGNTWTTPADAKTGLLRPDGEYHCAPMPVIEYNGRLWRPFEHREPPVGWGVNYCAGVLSANVDADLLDASSWTASSFLHSNTAWLDGKFGAWLEGNFVVTPDGRMVDILRVDIPACPEKAAVVNLSPDGGATSFDPAKGFIDFPGGAKKFAIRFDAQSRQYWSLANIVPDQWQGRRRPAGVRNALALTASPDLNNWSIKCIVLQHPDVAVHAFQYVDWMFDGQDMIVASRTAADDDAGGAHSAHDANYLTFHRIAKFREKSMADSAKLDQLRAETDNLVITGLDWKLAPFGNGQPAFANRKYVWAGVPKSFEGWRFTQTEGGRRATLLIAARHDVTAYCAATSAQGSLKLDGWQPVADANFHYTDKGRTTMALYRRDMKAGERLDLPQTNWAGTLLLVPPAAAPASSTSSAVSVSSATDAAAPQEHRSPITNGAIWKNDRPMELPSARRPKMQHVLIYQPETEWTYSHHASITFFKDRYYAIWSNGRKSEDDRGQRVLMSTSADFEKWTQPRPLVDSQKDEKGDERLLTSVGFPQHDGTLVAYFGNYGIHKETTHLQAVATTDGERWSAIREIGVPVNPNHGPQPTASGRLIIAGNISFPWTDDPTGLAGWHMTGIYPDSMAKTIKDDPASFWQVAKAQGWDAGLCEGSFYQTDDGALHMLLRDAARKFRHKLWITESRDNGQTWSSPVPTEFSDTNAKFHFGRLPDGRFYYVGNPIGGGRTPLALSISKDGVHFDKHYILGEEHYAMKRPGAAKGGEYGYPTALLRGGFLHVIVSRQKEGVEVMRVDLAELKE